MSSLASIRDTFFEECEDLLEAMAEGLATMHDGARDTETVNAVFRAVHSIKGGAGAFALTDLVTFAHRFETVLDAVRSDRLEADTAVMHTLQRSADHLADLVEAARTDSPTPPDETARFIESLDLLLGAPGGDTADEDFVFDALPLDFGAPEEAPAASVYDIAFRPHPALFANGHDPGLLFAALADLGTLESRIDLSGLPDWETLDPLVPHLAWSLRLTTSETETALHDVFEFVEGLCTLEIRPAQAEPPPRDPPPAPPPEPQEPTIAPKSAPAAAPEPRPASPARDESGEASSDARGPKPTLRVDLERVDRLINAVGELIINQAMIAQSLQDMARPAGDEVSAHVEDYRMLARDIQEAVMAIRAQPVKPLFQRMSRIVREAADATGKSARLVTVGEATEVDKTVIERLADPLTHMIRNAVDHGLESREARLAAGKEATGTIRLAAAHRSGSVVITLTDDGAGLNRARILEIARRKGLVPPDAELADSDIDALLFMPGFSTASTVSNLSGRGVGLDVVRNAVTALGGRITISSVPGTGTEFTITLPLTLAVMDGMVVSVAGTTMVVPITSILETIRPAAVDIHPIGLNESLLRIRGKFIPIVDVAQRLGLPAADDRGPAPLLLLVEVEAQGQCALMVDSVHDHRQVVIKGLATNYGAVAGVSAATVLGDGRVALILDPDAIASQRPPTTPAPDAQPTEGPRHAAE